jgi:hypothetical protein
VTGEAVDEKLIFGKGDEIDASLDARLSCDVLLDDGLLDITGAVSVFWTRRIISSRTESVSSLRRFSNTDAERVVVSTRQATASLRT